MTMYRVSWEIDIDADSHHSAALKALEIQRRPGSTATAFTVKDRMDDNAPTLCIDLEPWEVAAS